jgi:hypothetical protein
MAVINRTTGQPPTEDEQREIDARARQILGSPYSAPELVAWAIECSSPDVSEVWFWESCQNQAICERRQ